MPFDTYLTKSRISGLITYILIKMSILKISNLATKKKVYTTKELRQLGLSHYYIKKLLHNRSIEKIKRGKYVFASSDLSNESVVQQLIPTGILCLHSAAMIFNYSTYVPSEIHLAVGSKERHTLPTYPPVKLSI